MKYALLDGYTLALSALPEKDEVHGLLLFRAAECIVDRASIRQGVLALEAGEDRPPTRENASRVSES